MHHIVLHKGYMCLGHMELRTMYLNKTITTHTTHTTHNTYIVNFKQFHIIPKKKKKKNQFILKKKYGYSYAITSFRQVISSSKCGCIDRTCRAEVAGATQLRCGIESTNIAEITLCTVARQGVGSSPITIRSHIAIETISHRSRHRHGQVCTYEIEIKRLTNKTKHEEKKINFYSSIDS